MTRRRRKKRSSDELQTGGDPTVEMSALPSWSFTDQTGDKWAGAFGETQILTADYWTLRARSTQLFETNLYARGLIRRLINNEINTGLHLEAIPAAKLLGRGEDALDEWSEDVETRFAIWEKDPWLCDHFEQNSYGALQAIARMEALVAGDVLVVLRQQHITQLPRLQLICGSAVQTPMDATPAKGSKIVHGVEINAQGRHAAYWVVQDDGTSKRLPAWGEKSGRRLAWLVYGTDKRLDDVRGKPLLSLVLQSLREIDRYRDSVQRKAVINSMLAMFIKKAADKPGTRPMAGGAVRKGVVSDATTNVARRWKTSEHIPGLILDELQTGEEPHGFNSNGTDEKYADFEMAIIQAVAWANEIPPEVLTLSFNSNYSASQAAINEFKMYLNRIRTWFGENFCHPIYVEWLIAQALSGKIEASELLESWRDTKKYDLFGAWTASDWAGQIKPAVDLSKLVRAYKELAEIGGITRDRLCRELTGMKFSRVIRILKRENMLLAEANKPLAELEAMKKASPEAPGSQQTPDGDVDENDKPAKERKAA